jgi:hypothetical protein
MGYRYIALGGMVPLKTPQIKECLEAVNDVRLPGVGLHLLGISRSEHMTAFGSLGVVSFDSTSPFRQAFKDDKDNFYRPQGSFLAIRVPQVEGNAKLKGRIKAGRIDQARARQLEQLCLSRLVRFDHGQESIPAVLDALAQYAEVVEPGIDRIPQYRALLEAAPWKECPCGICNRAGIHVAIFRGTERNKRRGFHNLFVFSQRLENSRHTPETTALTV